MLLEDNLQTTCRCQKKGTVFMYKQQKWKVDSYGREGSKQL